ncbi:YadA-like family protein [Paraburkholderia strydomiana]|uniref:YadA-like family protein n=1 Tax=Paraburkholderia strydomiana TaxID=1245417 RepID=A0ABW9EHM8_9BURK
MNKSYISVWNDVSGTWVAAPETARTHCGTGTASSRTISSRTETASRLAVPLKAAFMPIAMAIGAAMLPGTAVAQASTGNGGLELCPGGAGGVGSSWGPLSSAVGVMDCSSTGENNAGMSFSLNNSAADNGAWGFNTNNITARVTGYDDGHLELKGTGGISMLNNVSMTGNKVTDLAAGDVSSDSTDAVNGQQLYQATRYFKANSASSDSSTDAQATGLNSVASGPSARALQTDSSAYGANAIALAASSVALGAGSQATRADTVSVGYLSPDGVTSYTRQITNVTAGSASTDAVNVAQLDAAIRGVSGGTGIPVDNPVTYDTPVASLITLKGATGTKITNLTDGDISSASSMDAVNGSQLFRTNQNVAEVANNVAGVTNIVNNLVANGLASSPLMVAYDSSARDTVTLGGAGNTAQVKLTHVAEGDISSASSTDAVNGGQLYQTNQNLATLAANVGALGPSLFDNGIKYFHTNSTLADSSAVGTDSVAIGGAALASAANSVALGSNSTADRANAVSVGAAGAERQIINVAAGSVDSDAVNLAQMKAAIASLGAGPGSPNAVVYDSATHDMLTLGGATTAPQVLVTNVAAGQVSSGSTDAVNGDQLYKSASGLASALGSGASVNSDGSITAPGYLVSGTTYNNIGDALSAINTAAGDLVGAAKYVKVVSTAPAALASGAESVAIGGGAVATKARTLAIGTGATAMFDNSTAIGVNAVTDASYTVSVGSRGAEMRITHVANGIDPTDAVTMAQLDALQSQITGTATSGVKSMMQNSASVLSYIAVSSYTTQGSATSAADVMNAMAIGPVAAATGVDALAVGAGAAAGSDSSTAIGSGAGALSVNSTAIGASATVGALSDNSVSIGYNTRASSTNALALGSYASATSPGSVSVGYNSFVSQAATSGLALGVNATVSAANSVAIGSGAIANRANVVSVGNASRQSQIVNMAAGTSSTDAVNVSQLSGVAAAIGGGATVNPDGTIQKPSFTIGGQTYADVGSALAATAGNSVQYDTPAHDKLTLGGTDASAPAVTLSNVANGVGDSDAVNVGQLKQLGMNVDDSGNLTNSFVAYDDKTLGAITLKGTDGTTIANVKAGELSDKSLEAVNGSQLYETNANVANVAGNLANVAGNVTNMGDVLNNIVVEGGGIKYFHANSTLADSSATGVDAVAIGGAASATAANSVALGANSVADRDNTVSVGAAGSERQIINVANATNNTDAVNLSQLRALGANVDSSGAVTSTFVAYDDATKNTITLRGAGATDAVLLTNVDKGQLAASSSDAVNGAQLYNVAQSTAKALGGQASLLADGTLSQPSYVITGSTYADVGSALSAVDGQLDQINTNFSTNLKYVKVVSSAGTAQAGGTESIAIGGNALATKANSLAIGAGATAAFANSTALGVNAITDAENTLSVGAKGQEVRITHVADGINLTDAATVGQLDALQTQLLANAASTSGVKSMMQSSAAVLSYIAVSSKVVQGGNTTASDDLNAMAIGPMASATGEGALAVGAGAIAGSSGSTAVGTTAAIASINATAIGEGASVGAYSDNAVSIGYNARASGMNATAMGTTASATSIGSVAIGYGSFAAQAATGGMALGLNSTVSAANGVAIGYGAIADRANAVSVGNSGRQSQIINVAEGTSNTDAVNLGQMTAAINAAAGGGSPDAVIYDTPAHDKLTLNNGGAAVTVSNVAAGVANNDAVNVGQLTAMGAKFDTSGNLSNAFVAYDDANKTQVTLGGTGSTVPVVLANVGAGQVASSSKQAINGSQLYGAMSSTAAALGGGSTVNSDGQVSKPVYTIDGNSYSGVDSVVNALNDKIKTGGNADGVAYDTSAHDMLTLGGAGAKTPVTIANLASATADDQAVNLKQMKDAGLSVDSSGNVTNSFVTYDNAGKTTLTFNSGGTPTQLKNVAIGVDATDGVNVGQMQSYVSTYVNTNGGGGGGGGGGTANAVAYDDSSKSQVTLGGTGALAPVKLTNVAEGTAATDAVNYGQFSSLQSQLNNLQAGDGTGGSTYINVGAPGAGDSGTAAVASGSDSIAIGSGAAATGTESISIGKAAVTAGNGSVALGSGATAPNTNSVALGAGSTTDRDNSVSMGAVGAERQITNVAAGTQGTDAVNMNQLNSAMGNMNNSIHNIDRNAAKGIASSSALNIVTPYLPGRTTLNAGIANYRGYQAVGLGVSRWNEKGSINYNLGVSTSGGNSTIVRAGIGIVLGN